MATLTRQTQQVFAGNANNDQLAAFGSMKTGSPQYSTDLATLQTTAYTQGWTEAIQADKAPYLEEMNAVQYGMSYQIVYLLQEGMPTYDPNTNYSNTSIVKSIVDSNLVFYLSLADDNQGNALTNTAFWKKIDFSELINNAVMLTGNQTIAGTKTFSASPIVPTAAQTDSSTKAASTAFVKLWSMVPKWASKANRTPATTYTAASNGFVVMYAETASENIEYSFKINSVEVYKSILHGLAGGIRCVYFSFPIAKGDKYVLTGKVNNTNSQNYQGYYFVPVA